MLVRIHLTRSHGPRGPGPYLVDVDEARALVAAGAADAPSITPVFPQAGYADDGVVEATRQLVEELTPPPPDDGVADVAVVPDDTLEGAQTP